ncbi:ABC transporter permease [Kiritimatiella glycovorans]|uniref:Macrolide export ATP-binding/permease protein MacB n=1 Tax=Kiritimatiella glycovorans TaxID=1307763 RepID=A0A0G3EI75_9BACT|nr:ABC transporter permease [Kiritimatiella glycovorans]AKJ65142.1 Macrolide export ATP-binding/permease protein MacB [Kiritimatiella glycovorans]
MIEVRDIVKTYRMGDVEVRALRGCSLRIDRGEFVAITGPSGSGKSTLMHILGLLDTPDSGSYRLEGHEVSRLTDDQLAIRRARSIGFVFQQFNLLARVSALENTALPLIYRDHPSPADPEDLLKRVGLGDRKEHTPGELSGGQQQRVAIARALVNRPSVMMADEPTGNLDSASSGEILTILRKLNETGLTVIVVTHDPEVTAVASRVISIRDGRVTEDRGRVPADSASGSVAKDTDFDFRVGGEHDARTHPLGWIGRKLDEAGAMFRQAVRALMANKTRTALSMLGVLIGVAALIAVMALGTGAREAVEERISRLGANLLVLRPGARQRGAVRMAAGATSRLTLEDAEALPRRLPSVDAAAPVVNGMAQLTWEGHNWRTSITGTTPAYLRIHDYELLYGRNFTAAEVENRARVALVGTTLVRELFDGSNPIGRTLRMNRVRFEVIGILPEMGASFGRDPNDMVIIPVTTAMKRLFGKTYINTVEIRVVDRDHMEYTEKAVIRLMKERHRIDPEREAFSVFNMGDLREAITATSKTMALLLAGIGGVSLFVGGIGIMNIMLVSVTERTREIGIRKAVGAKRSDVLAQFLIEAAVIGIFGGFLGILTGWGASLAMTRYAGWNTIITPLTVGLAFTFSAVVGVIFGLWPARKASRLNPIDALRYE